MRVVSIAISVLLFIHGLPGHIDDHKAWGKWVGAINIGWPAVIGENWSLWLAVAFMLYGIFPFVKLVVRGNLVRNLKEAAAPAKAFLIGGTRHNDYRAEKDMALGLLYLHPRITHEIKRMERWGLNSNLIGKTSLQLRDVEAYIASDFWEELPFLKETLQNLGVECPHSPSSHYACSQLVSLVHGVEWYDFFSNLEPLAKDGKINEARQLYKTMRDIS